MHIRPAQPQDLDLLIDIDATIESGRYLHLSRGGEGLAVHWSIEERPMREKPVNPNATDPDQAFALRQIVTGAQEGTALVAEHDGLLVALGAGEFNPGRRTLEVLDIRVDFEHRRQGLGSALLYQLIMEARQNEARAVAMRTLTSNFPAASFLLKAGFDLCGVDTRFSSNEDLVKESASLFWYLALE